VKKGNDSVYSPFVGGRLRPEYGRRMSTYNRDFINCFHQHFERELIDHAESWWSDRLMRTRDMLAKCFRGRFDIVGGEYEFSVSPHQGIKHKTLPPWRCGFRHCPKTAAPDRILYRRRNDFNNVVLPLADEAGLRCYYAIMPYVTGHWTVEQILDLAIEAKAWSQRLGRLRLRPGKSEYPVIAGRFMGEVNLAVGRLTGVSPPRLAPYGDSNHKPSSSYKNYMSLIWGVERAQVLAWPTFLAVDKAIYFDQKLLIDKWQRKYGPNSGVIIRPCPTAAEAWHRVHLTWSELWFCTMLPTELADLVVGFHSREIRGVSHIGLLYGKVEHMREQARMRDERPPGTVRVSRDHVEVMNVAELARSMKTRFAALDVKLDTPKMRELEDQLRSVKEELKRDLNPMADAWIQ